MRTILKTISIIAVALSFSNCVRHTQDSEQDIKDNINPSEITQADIVKALEFVGIGIHKINIGEFDSPYKIKFVLEEFKDLELYRADTIDYDIVNVEYAYADTNKVTKEVAYIEAYSEMIRIFTQQLGNKVLFEINAPRVTFTEELEFRPEHEADFYKVVEYEKTNWNLDEKVPLLLCGSSWVDNNGIRRFCAPNMMGDNSMSKTLLDSSPHYCILSYITEEIEK